jgi:hypothetical protein
MSLRYFRRMLRLEYRNGLFFQLLFITLLILLVHQIYQYCIAAPSTPSQNIQTVRSERICIIKKEQGENYEPFLYCK